jgi:hypothetical protein
MIYDHIFDQISGKAKIAAANGKPSIALRRTGFRTRGVSTISGDRKRIPIELSTHFSIGGAPGAALDATVPWVRLP